MFDIAEPHRVHLASSQKLVNGVRINFFCFA